MVKAKQLADGRFECQNCLRRFTAVPRSKESPKGYINEPKFCKATCRMAFHDAGGMNFKKFDARMEKLVGESLEVRLRAYDQLVAKFVNGATAELRAELRPGAFRRRKKTT